MAISSVLSAFGLAIKEALDLSWGPAILVVLIGAVATGLFYTVVCTFFAGTMTLVTELRNAIGGP